MGGKLQRDGTIFMGEVDFNLAIGGEPGWKKWLENGEGKSLYFMRLFLHYILFGQNFVG